MGTKFKRGGGGGLASKRSEIKINNVLMQYDKHSNVQTMAMACHLLL